MGVASLYYAVLAQGHRCGELIEVAPADIKCHRATERTTKKGMRLQSQIGLLNTSHQISCLIEQRGQAAHEGSDFEYGTEISQMTYPGLITNDPR